MRVSSTATMQKALVALRNALGGPTSPEEGLQVAQQLLQLEALFASNARLARAVTDPARSAQAKQQLVERMFSQRVAQPVAQALAQLAAGRWSADGDLAQACHIMTKHVLLKTANDQGRLEQVEREIFALGRVLQNNRQLRLRLSERGLPPAQRQQLVTRLIGDQVGPETLALVKDAVGRSEPGRLQADLRALCQAAAAMRGRITATVTSATALSDSQVERLSKALEKQNGREVDINLVINPEVLGGLRINLEEKVLDATVRSSLEHSKRQLKAS